MKRNDLDTRADSPTENALNEDQTKMEGKHSDREDMKQGKTQNHSL